MVGRLIGVLAAAALAGMFAACDGDAARGGGDLSLRPIRAVTTIGMIADIVGNVGGERVAVAALMGPGIDPHLYKATEGDVSRMAGADIVFYNGLHLEAKLAEILEEMSGRTNTVAVTEYIPRDTLLRPPEFKGAYDPHVWFDVELWMKATEKVRDALIAMDSTHAALYTENAGKYLATLADLDEYIAKQAARVPENKRVLVTAHDAFNYFGRAYGFQVRGLQGISTATEAGAADVQALSAFIAERRIPAIFVETSVPRRTIEAVQAAVRSRGFDVKIGGSLYSDAMGNPGTPDGTYPGMVRHNVDTIVRALLGTDEEPTGVAGRTDARTR